MENNNVSITLCNGLGDKSLDLIGFVVLCKNLNYNPIVSFYNNSQFAWGNNNYDIRLFNFNEITISDNRCEYNLISTAPSASLSPYKVYEFIKNFSNEVTFEKISNDFVEYSKKIIQPSEIILSKIPNDINKAYGIHLRKTDKVNNSGDIRHENRMDEFIIIINRLLNDVRNIIISEEDPTFLIVSEDDDWKYEITNIIKNISNTNNKQIKIIELNYHTNTKYHNFNSVLDMFCLSKCKEILQGVKYSTFSILASLLGNNKMRNYSNYIDSNDVCLIHNWASVIEINNNKNLDIEHHKKITDGIPNLQTNIIKKM